jgi:hypothetical protein
MNGGYAWNNMIMLLDVSFEGQRRPYTSTHFWLELIVKFAANMFHKLLGISWLVDQLWGSKGLHGVDTIVIYLNEYYGIER